MTTRETTTFKAGEHDVVAYEYVTGRDLREIEKVTLDSLQVKADANGGGDVSGFTGEMLTKREDLQIKAVIVSVDGKKDGDTIEDKQVSIVDLVLDMKADDYDVVMKYVRDITEKKS